MSEKLREEFKKETGLDAIYDEVDERSGETYDAPEYAYMEFLEQRLEAGQVDASVMQHKEIKQLAYDAIAFLEQLENEGEFKFWGDGYNRQVLNELKKWANKLGVA